MIVTPEKQSHWYSCQDGKIVPVYETERADGKGMRATNLGDAKKNGYLYSITKVANMLPKEALNAWKQEQAILAALTLQRIKEPFEMWRDRIGIILNKNLTGEEIIRWFYDNQPRFIENEDQFCKRVVEDMEAQSEKAKQRGTEIHQAIADYLQGYYPPPDMEPWLKGFMDWADNELKTNPTVPQCELVVGDKQLGIGGRLDLLAELNGRGMCVTDFKSQFVKSNGSGIKKPVWYPEWPIQLAAYEQCIDGFQNLVSVIIDTSEPGPVFVKQWEDPGMYWEMFEHCYELTCYLNDYDPRPYEPIL